MKAIKSPIVGGLIPLADRVPLKQPLGVALSIGNICDFRCKYCDFANISEQEKKRNGYVPHQMKMQEFDEFATQLKEFEQPIKQLTFVSHGETILNPNLPDMIARIKKDGSAEVVKVTTNANRLTKEVSDALIEAGLDLIKISIQGLTGERYLQVCQTKVEIDRLLKQIKYFFDNRRQCKVYIKILDVALQEGEEAKFFDMFGDIADNIFIEQCFGEMAKSEKSNKLNMSVSNINICPMPFYTFPIDVMGNVSPCCRLSKSVDGERAVIANIYEKNLKQIWEEDFYQLQQRLLTNTVEEAHICNGCKLYFSIAKFEDKLDEKLDEILQRYS